MSNRFLLIMWGYYIPSYRTICVGSWHSLGAHHIICEMDSKVPLELINLGVHSCHPYKQLSLQRFIPLSNNNEIFNSLTLLVKEKDSRLVSKVRWPIIAQFSDLSCDQCPLPLVFFCLLLFYSFH